MGKQFEWEQLSVVKAQTKENLRPCQGLRSNRRENRRRAPVGRGRERRPNRLVPEMRKDRGQFHALWPGDLCVASPPAHRWCSSKMLHAGHRGLNFQGARWGWDRMSSACPIYKARFLQSFQAVNTIRGPKLSYCSAYQVQLLCISQH